MYRSACVLGAGEILWDQLPGGDTIGGAPFNVVSHLARLGYRAGYLTAVGRDADGDAALADMRARGIGDSLVGTVDAIATGRAVVRLDPGGSPEFDIVRPAAFEWLTAAEEEIRWIYTERPLAFVFGTLALLRPRARAAVARVTAACPDAVRLYDVNLRKGWWAPETVTELIRQATVVKFSEAEATELAPALGVRWDGPAAFCSDLAACARLRGVAVTSGSASASLWLDGAYSRQAPPAISVSDAVGAGDAFAAGLLDAIMAGLPAARALRRANALGSIVASRPGAQPYWTPAELANLEGTAGHDASG
jgi:fructokinase